MSSPSPAAREAAREAAHAVCDCRGKHRWGLDGHSFQCSRITKALERYAEERVAAAVEALDALRYLNDTPEDALAALRSRCPAPAEGEARDGE